MTNNKKKQLCNKTKSIANIITVYHENEERVFTLKLTIWNVFTQWSHLSNSPSVDSKEKKNPAGTDGDYKIEALNYYPKNLLFSSNLLNLKY